MKKLFLIVAVLLSGCTVFGAQKPTTVYVPQKVEVPVPVKCTPPKIAAPKYVFSQAKKDDLLYNNLQLLAAENDNLIAYNTKLKAALDGCTK